MPELVFYDHRHPLKRKWSGACEAERKPDHKPRMPTHTQLPRLPSLAAWANIEILNRAVCPVDLPPVGVINIKKEEEDPAAVEEEQESTPKMPPMRNTSRERMKAEQAALRAQAASLENALACIHQIQTQRLTGQSQSQTETTTGCSAWQAMAQQQWEQRVEAEKENKRLRATVGGLMDEVKGLESLFKSRSSALSASLRQSSQLALQVQALLAEERPGATDDSPTLRQKQRKLSSSSAGCSSTQQSPRDVAYAVEPWSSQSSG